VCFRPLFGSVGGSVITLIQILVFDDTFSIIRPAFQNTFFIGFILLTFIFLASFTILNMLIGVICEIVTATTAEEKAARLQDDVENLFNNIDNDQSGHITREEAINEETKKRLRKLGIAENLLETAFDLLDTDGSGTLELDEFVPVMLALLRPPDSQDLLITARRVERLWAWAQANDEFAALASRKAMSNAVMAAKEAELLGEQASKNSPNKRSRSMKALPSGFFGVKDDQGTPSSRLVILEQKLDALLQAINSGATPRVPKDWTQAADRKNEAYFTVQLSKTGTGSKHAMQTE